jgi:hypothetical protein
MTVGTGNDIAVLTAIDGTYRFYVGHGVAGSAPFRVTKAGALTAVSGTVGGWALSSTTLSAGACVFHSDGYMSLGTGNDIVTIDGSGAVYRFWVGHAVSSSAPFQVTKAGALISTDATLTGSLTCGGGDLLLDASGITMTAGNGEINMVKWKDAADTTTGTLHSHNIGSYPTVKLDTGVPGSSSYFGEMTLQAWANGALSDSWIQIRSAYASAPGFIRLKADYTYIDTKLRIGSTGDPGSWELYVTGQAYASDYVRADGGLTTCSTDPGADRLYVGDYAKIMGGLHVGGTSDPGTDNLWVDGDCRFGSGVWIGATGTNPDDNDLHIDGSINKSTSLSCVVYRSTNQLIPNSSYTALSYNVQVTDTDGMFAPTSSRMYAKKAGFYIFGASIFWDAIVSAQSHIITARKNGSIYLAQQGHTAASSHANRACIVSGSYMAANDYIEILIYQTSGASRNVRDASSTNMRFNSAWMTRVA